MAPPETDTFISTFAFDEERIRAASIYCSDGRYGEQMDEFLHERLGLPRYDRLAVPGGPACLSGSLAVFWEGRSAEQQLDFLRRVHGLERVVLIAHEGCAFYREWLKVPADQMLARQRADLAAAKKRIGHLDAKLVVEGYFARRAGARVWLEPVPL
jgi:hypothetical protein